jgi:hypothetical protein
VWARLTPAGSGGTASVVRIVWLLRMPRVVQMVTRCLRYNLPPRTSVESTTKASGTTAFQSWRTDVERRGEQQLCPLVFS